MLLLMDQREANQFVKLFNKIVRMDYYQGYEDGMRQTRVTRGFGLIGFLLRSIISVFYSAFVYLPLLVLSYFIATSLSRFYSSDVFIKIGLTIAFSYLLFSFIYFIKGIMIGLRNAGRISWLALWLLCVVLTCGVQVIISQNLLADFFTSRQIANAELWSWLGATSILILIYSHYQFLTNIAPGVIFWSYRLGFMSVNAKNGMVKKSEPHKSKAYFENAPMNISYKKE